jgi:hypothetical protein
MKRVTGERKGVLSVPIRVFTFGMIPVCHPNFPSVTLTTRLTQDRKRYFPTSASSPAIIKSDNVHSVVPPSNFNHNPPPLPPDSAAFAAKHEEMVVLVMEMVLSVPAVRERAPPEREEEALEEVMEVLRRVKDWVVEEGEEKKTHGLFPFPLMEVMVEWEMEKEPDEEKEEKREECVVVRLSKEEYSILTIPPVEISKGEN